MIYGCVRDDSPIKGMPQGCNGCIVLLAANLWIFLHDHPQCGGKTPGHVRGQGMHQDVSRTPWTDRFADFYISRRCQLINENILQHNITPVSIRGVEHWISGCLDAKSCKRGLGPAH